MEIPEARWIVWLTILLIAIIVAVYVAKIFRDMAVGENVTTGNLLSDFDRLRNEGKLNDDEYQKLKSTIRETQESQQVSGQKRSGEQQNP